MEENIKAVYITDHKTVVFNNSATINRPRECIKVKTAYVGICGSDLHMFNSKHPNHKPPVDIIPGHEASGVVAEKKNGFEVGDNVVLFPLVGCGVCLNCQKKQPNICLSRKVIGYHFHGAMANLFFVPEKQLLRLPQNFPLWMGALIEPFAVAVHISRYLKSLINDVEDVVITGAGGISIYTALLLKYKFKCRPIIVCREYKYNYVSNLGLVPITGVLDLDQSKSYNYIECTGSNELLGQILSTLPAPRSILLVGTFAREDGCSLYNVTRYETLVRGIQMYTIDDFKDAIQLLSDVDFSVILSETINEMFSCDDVQEAFDCAGRSFSKSKTIIKFG